jgi:ribonuclease HI
MQETEVIDTLATKLNPRDLPIGHELATDLARNILRNTQLLPARLPSALRYHSFLLIHNALPTRSRERWRAWDTLCPFCHGQEETLRHLHTTCPAALEAIALIQRDHCDSKDGGAILTKAFPEDYLFRTPELKADELVTILTFSLAVWRTRRSFYDRPFQPHFTFGAATAIAACFAKLQASIKVKRSSRRRDRQAEQADFLAMYDALPCDCLTVFTDGSALNNDQDPASPGPAGAGVYIFDGRLDAKQPKRYSSYSIGPGTSLFAELAALLRALQQLLFLARSPGGIPSSVYIFIDNLTAINNSLGVWKANTHLEIIDAIRPCLSELRLLTNVFLRWVPGHAGVPGNEVADFLAKRGAKGIASTSSPPADFLCSLQSLSSPSLELQFADDLPPPTCSEAVLSTPLTCLPPPPSIPTPQPTRRSKRKRSEANLLRQLYPGVDFSQFALGSKKHRR